MVRTPFLNDAQPYSALRSPVKVTIGGEELPVLYQGLAPGLVGLYQVNVLLSPSIVPGDAVPVVIKQEGVSSNPVTLPVRAPGE